MADTRLVTTYIEAGSPMALRSLMLKTDVEAHAQHHYFDVQTYVNRRGQTRWIAWFKKQMTNKEFVEMSGKNDR